MFILRDKSIIGLSTNLMLMAAAYNAPGPVLYLSISLYLASVTPKHTHNRVVEFQSQSRGKGGIRLCP